MTNLAPTPGTWNIVLRRITDPVQQKALGAKSLGVVAVSALLSIGGFALALSGISWSGWILGVLGLGAVGIWVMLAVNSRVASTMTGDDLIEILVAEEGVVGQGGLAIGWDEISGIQFEWSRAVMRGAGAAVGAALGAAGIDTATKAIQIQLKDYRAVKARASSKFQRLVLLGPMLGDPGYMHVGQNGNSTESVQELLAVLTDQANRHGVPVTRKSTS